MAGRTGIEARAGLTAADLITLLCLAAYLPVVLLLHVAWYRFHPALRAAPAQGAAAKVVVIGCVVALTCVGALTPRESEWLSHLVFAGIALISLGSFYFTFLCVSESGRRYYLLNILDESKGGLSRLELLQLYGKQYMIEMRLRRLLAWDVAEQVGDRLVLRKKPFYACSLFFYYWAKLLGYRWFREEAK